MKKILYTIITVEMFIPGMVFAQGVISLSAEGTLTPGQTVTVHINSPFMDLGGTQIIWSANGQLIGEGLGQTSQQVTLGDVGISTTVTAAFALDNKAYKEDLVLTPGFIDVLWEAETSVPPFYHGKALPSHESIVKTYAIPYFGSSTPGTYPEFTWKKDGSITIAKGINRSSAQFLGAWEKTAVPISVTAKQGDLSINDDERIMSYIPSALFYQISPMQGVLTQSALRGQVNDNDVELSVLAIPYGVALSERDSGNVQYDWGAEGNNIQEGLGKAYERVTLSRANDKNTSGKISITYAAQNTINVMQLAKGAFDWIFTTK
jgi:hypothetical protein